VRGVLYLRLAHFNREVSMPEEKTDTAAEEVKAGNAETDKLDAEALAEHHLAKSFRAAERAIDGTEGEGEDEGGTEKGAGDSGEGDSDDTGLGTGEDSGEKEGDPEDETAEDDIEALKLAAKKLHLLESAMEEKPDLVMDMLKEIQGKESNTGEGDLPEEIAIDDKILLEGKEGEIGAHIMKVVNDLVDRKLADTVGGLLKKHAETSLEEEFPFYKDPNIKKDVQTLDRILRTSGVNTSEPNIKKTMILAVMAGNPDAVLEFGKSLSKKTSDGKRAVSSKGGHGRPREKAKEEKTLGQGVADKLLEVHPWGD